MRRLAIALLSNRRPPEVYGSGSQQHRYTASYHCSTQAMPAAGIEPAYPDYESKYPMSSPPTYVVFTTQSGTGNQVLIRLDLVLWLLVA